MDIFTVTGAIGSVLAMLGGGAVVVAGLSGWLGKLWAERLMRNSTQEHEKVLERIRDEYRSDLEKLRNRLKKSEFVFEKEFLAASALAAYHEKIIPIGQCPDMHMNDVFVSIARDFDDVEVWIKEFVSAHGAVLPEDVAKNLMMAARIAGEFKFRLGEGPDEAVDSRAIDAAEDVYDRVRLARDVMKERVWNQSST
ncbi:hypothetical protein QO259_12680 [Salinicola sp. JS01]|uniref:hypothetical protein n=1 Tax=Salinicola sp. JS01 TaxID=3050071 RepID=UPI00255B6989|nr:hypothetical protein [Salinicola sp. JS01]WIX31669.1 hypothetical protein QO259_12680 [Salinicola sp. JS01]